MSKDYIEIKDKKIPVVVRNYKNTNELRIYIKKGILNISKPTFLSNKEVIKQIKKNEKKIYEEYTKIEVLEKENIKHWENGEKLMYIGKMLDIIMLDTPTNNLEIHLEQEKNKIEIKISNNLNGEEKKYNIDRGIKTILKNNTEVMLAKKLPEISKKIGIEYKSFKVRDAVTRLGSCAPKEKTLNFSSRLIMLPENIIEEVIVHELCHIIHPNHSKDFYNLVKIHKSDYLECDKWLKENDKCILF